MCAVCSSDSDETVVDPSNVYQQHKHCDTIKMQRILQCVVLLLYFFDATLPALASCRTWQCWCLSAIINVISFGSGQGCHKALAVKAFKYRLGSQRAWRALHEPGIIVAGGPPSMYIVVYIHRVYKWYIRYVYGIYGGPPAKAKCSKWRPPTTMIISDFTAERSYFTMLLGRVSRSGCYPSRYPCRPF